MCDVVCGKLKWVTKMAAKVGMDKIIATLEHIKEMLREHNISECTDRWNKK